MVYCAKCERPVPGNLEAFKDHLKNEPGHLPPFICAHGACTYSRRLFSVKSSFIRHLESHDDALTDSENESSSGGSSGPDARELFPVQPVPLLRTASTAASSHHSASDEEGADNGSVDVPGSPPPDDTAGDFILKLERAAAHLVLQLWRHGNVPGVAISRVVTETTDLTRKVVTATQDVIASKLRRAGVNEETINESVRNIFFFDPFRNLKDKEQQMDKFEELYNLVKPEPKPLGWRMDDRVDRESGVSLPVEIAVNCQYVSLIKTLTAVLNNPVLFKLIHNEKPSSDGRLRTYLDGELCENHPLISKYPNTLRLVKWMDDSEVVNAQGSKTAVHKIVADCYTVQNGCQEENSRLRSIHLSSYSYREDLPEERGVDALLDPFFAELEQLESEEGVPIIVNNEPFTLRATLIAFAADTLAAHELLGLSSPSSNRFCSVCLVHKQEFYQNILAEGVLRSKCVHAQNLEELTSKGPKFAALSSGVKRLSTPVEKSKYAEFPEAMIKDPMHDYLRGMVPMEIKLVLREYVVEKKYFEVEDFNAALKSFNYGPPDMKNKPSPNFTLDSLQSLSYVLHQSASQAWCLLRVFPFIISAITDKVPQDCPHLKLLLHMKRMTDLVLSSVISDDDLDLYDRLTREHHLLFMTLYPGKVQGPVQEQQEEMDEDNLDEDFLCEEQEDDPAGVPADGQNPPKKRKRYVKVVRPLNKHHHATHYRMKMKKYGPINQYWCMRFEGKNALSKRFGAICNNFQNLPVTFADLHQISHAADLMDITCAVQDELSYSKGKTYAAVMVPDFATLSEVGISETDVLVQTPSATVGGFKFQLGLYLALPFEQDNLPMFGRITGIYVHDSSLYVVTQDVKTVSFDERFAAYLINESDEQIMRAVVPSSLPPVRPIAAWSAANSLYLSPKNVIADLYVNNPAV